MARSNRRSRRRRSRNQRGGFFTNPFSGLFGKKEEEKPVVAPTSGMGGEMHIDTNNPYVGGRRRRRRRTKRRKSRRGRKSRKKRRKSRKSRRRRRR